jgi:hypothetical protein
VSLVLKLLKIIFSGEYQRLVFECFFYHIPIFIRLLPGWECNLVKKFKKEHRPCHQSWCSEFLESGYSHFLDNVGLTMLLNEGLLS